MTPEFDIIIVGSGPAGVSAAFPLVESGLKVLMVDGGRHSDITLPDKPFLNTRTEDANQWEWMIGKNFHALQMQEAISPKLRVPTQGYVFDGFGAANRIESQEFVAVGSLAAGGLSNAWGCGVSCLSAEELTKFPFNASEIDRSYEAVAKRIGISGPQDDDLSEYFRLDAWAQPPIPIDNLHTHLYDRYTKQRDDLVSRGFRLGRTRNAVLSKDHSGRKACDRLGNCLWGCHRHATYSAADEIGLLRQFKNFYYESGFIVDGLVRNEDCWSIEGQQVISRVRRSISTHKVFLAAGTLATSRLALKTLAISSPVPLLSCPTAAFLLWMPRFLGASRAPFFGLGQLSFSLAIQDNINGFGTTLSTTGIPVSEFSRYLPLRRRYAVDILGSLMSSCLVGNIFLPGEFSDANVTLKNDGSLLVSGGYQDDVSFLFEVAEKKLRKAYWKLGAALLPMSFTIGRPGGDIHYSGTLPMRESPSLGETNAHGELHGLIGVHVVDGASLPSLTEKAHTLTIMANADRISRAVAEQMNVTY
jgi:hypothetical protein